MDFLKLKPPLLYPTIIFLSFIVIGSIGYLVISSNDQQITENSTNQVQHKRINTNSNIEAHPIVVIFFVVLLILLTLSIFTNILLFKWRKTSSDGQISIVPVELIKCINLLNENFLELGEKLSLNIKNSEKGSKNAKDLFEDLLESFTVLQSALNKRDKEIHRLRKGYDAEIYRKYLGRLIKVDNALSYEINVDKSDNKNNQKLKEVQELLRDALDECGVVAFSPKIGASIRDEFGIADNYKTKPAKNSEEEFTIAEVIEAGFKIQTPDGPDCIKKSKVIVYLPQKGN
jgi:hypothetical protein